MQQYLNAISTFLKLTEWITLNTASVIWVIINYAQTAIAEELSWSVLIRDPKSVVSVLVGLSIVFFNVARGISVLRKNNQKDGER